MIREPKLSSLRSQFIPSQTGEAKDVLLLVHGRTGNLRLLQWYAKRFKIPNLAYLAVEAPYPDQREDQKDPGFSWYIGKYEGIESSREKLNRSVEEILSSGLESSRNLYWLGFSQGASMGLDFALRSNYQLGGFLCISGFCIRRFDYPDAFGPYAKKQRILITHGIRDEIVPFKEAKASYDRLTELGVPFEFIEFDKPHSFHLKREVPLLEEKLKSWIENQTS